MQWGLVGQHWSIGLGGWDLQFTAISLNFTTIFQSLAFD